jgi:hypothetical protein
MTVTDKQGGPRPLHALVGDDKLAAWSNEDKTKLQAFEVEWERDGPVAMERTMKKDPGFYMQLMVVLVPHVVREMLENVLINEGLTNADVMLSWKVCGNANIE